MQGGGAKKWIIFSCFFKIYQFFTSLTFVVFLVFSPLNFAYFFNNSPCIVVFFFWACFFCEFSPSLSVEDECWECNSNLQHFHKGERFCVISASPAFFGIWPKIFNYQNISKFALNQEGIGELETVPNLKITLKTTLKQYIKINYFFGKKKWLHTKIICWWASLCVPISPPKTSFWVYSRASSIFNSQNKKIPHTYGTFEVVKFQEMPIFVLACFFRIAYSCLFWFGLFFFAIFFLHFILWDPLPLAYFGSGPWVWPGSAWMNMHASINPVFFYPPELPLFFPPEWKTGEYLFKTDKFLPLQITAVPQKTLWVQPISLLFQNSNNHRFRIYCSVHHHRSILLIPNQSAVLR